MVFPVKTEVKWGSWYIWHTWSVRLGRPHFQGPGTSVLRMVVAGGEFVLPENGRCLGVWQDIRGTDGPGPLGTIPTCLF